MIPILPVIASSVALLSSSNRNSGYLGASSTSSNTFEYEREPLLRVSALHRYAVKGLSYDALNEVALTSSCFPDDRRYALLKTSSLERFNNEFLHKNNFVCAFTHAQLLSRFQSKYRVESGNDEDDATSPQRLLDLVDRHTGRVLLDSVRLDTELGRAALATFVSEQSGTPVVCVTSAAGDFQFGNTSSGVNNGDPKARSIHVVLQSTIDALQEKIGIAIRPSRFRPNIVLTSTTPLPPFCELDWMGHILAHRHGNDRDGLQLKIVNKTVRCDGVGVDPLDPNVTLDIPKLLVQHFPEQGPYLGVYCTLQNAGTLAIGDELRLF